MNSISFVGDVSEQRRFPTSFYRSSCIVVLQRDLTFAASSGFIVRSKSLSLESWEKVLKYNRGEGLNSKDTGSMSYDWFVRSKTVMFCGCFLACEVVL